VHSDGEIWAQTLWDLRDALGVTDARRLITRAMELSPPDPSFLDMRNAILQADLVANGGADANVLWTVFRHRGMGYFASVEDGNDTTPAPDGHAPPSCKTDPCGSLGGRLTDRLTGAPVANARVSIGGHSAGFPGTDLTAKVTVLSEGTRGTLSQAYRQWQGVGSPNPQIFALGVKEVWETKRPLDRVIHTMGWPLPTDAFGVSQTVPVDPNTWGRA
jgi:hypothetical protein